MLHDPIIDWPRTDADVDALPMAQLAAPMSARCITRATYFVNREQPEDDLPVPEVTARRISKVTIMTDKLRVSIIELRRAGFAYASIQRELGCSQRSVSRVLGDAGLTGAKIRGL